MVPDPTDPSGDAPEPDLSDALDAGLGRGRSGAERTCLVTRVAQPPSKLIRFVLSPDGEVVPDLRARLPGRGAWLTPTRAAVADALKRRVFQRAFKTKDAAAPADLADRIAAGLRADLRQSLALANKAGCVVAGFAKVESAIGDKLGVAGVIQASDGSADGRRKIAAALHRRYGDAISRVPIIDDLSNEELDMALGRDHVIHAALVAGVGSTGCLARWRRLRSFEGLATTAEEAGSARNRRTASDLQDDEVTDLPGAQQFAGSRDDGNPQGLD
ncbi:RNA-binding protein [Methylobacterium sp. BTF04]|uniref:RNA-binding protein n=1 Tax=Methylobacterium sp. BTF04 TaxID=2708300 RepID=UPI0013D1BDE2|nr:RNA-binding protein [Methylobacterium sp. BTF04]NEU12432.1 RNA-binding protein [Methylobacterium sp. BTF04]